MSEAVAGMRYYFAGRYSRHPELRGYRDDLATAIPGAVVTSRWIDCHPDIGAGLARSFTPAELAADPAGCWTPGSHDLEDLAAADTLVSFTGAGGGGKGGRHVEYGVAVAYAMDPHRTFRLVLVGPRENVFHCHPAVQVYATWPEFLAAEVLRCHPHNR